MAAAVQNLAQAGTGESKSARKKRAKAEGGSVSNGSAAVPVVPDAAVKEDSSVNAAGDPDLHAEHPYIKELSKHIRNIHKKLAGMQRIDAIIAENPGSSLDELVAARKINADQKSSVEKKPQLQAQLTALEDQVLQYRKFDTEHQTQMQRQRDDLTAQHQKELEAAREGVRLEGVTVSEAELRSKLLIFSQFLRCAAARRAEDEQNTDEHRAFEGVLLQVYGGNEDAVQAAVKLIDGSDEQVTSIEGDLLSIKYSQVRQASIDHTPFQTEEDWVDSVAEANALSTNTPAPEVASDPTIAYAGLTELETPASTNGVAPAQGAEDPLTSPPQVDAGDSAGNAAGDQWDTTVASADKELMDDSIVIVPRPADDLETPVSGATGEKMRWADEPPPSYDAAPSGNTAGEAWDTKAAGDQGDSTWNGAEVAAQAGAGIMVDGAGDASSGAPTADADGFHEVPGRNRGRGRGRGGDGDFRGRGRGRGGFRGDGDFRARGRGGFRGGRGDGGEFRGEYRGRGGRGLRGFRGSGDGPAPARGS